ncbi:unnamed protein product [Lupinus luteus]|uniref:C2H2-type domain-containing protein n=1 Tax=Lupinus luteus TaxID=3873 RepID=A0AAV1XHN9_LUPLU
MANYLMLLSCGGEFETTYFNSSDNTNNNNNNRVFECKTCNRQFPSFQALGGHRASHKKLRLMGEELNQMGHDDSPPKAKTHECSICGLEFSIGQALGGHMRRHRVPVNSNGNIQSSTTKVITSVSSVDTKRNKGNNSKKLLFLDLNLTPLENDNVEILKTGHTISLVDCHN